MDEHRPISCLSKASESSHFVEAVTSITARQLDTCKYNNQSIVCIIDFERGLKNATTLSLSTTKQTTMTPTYRLYNYKTGHLYSDHPTLEGAFLLPCSTSKRAKK